MPITQVKRKAIGSIVSAKCVQLPSKVCLYYHMGQCLAPCVKEIDGQVYQEMIEDMTKFLNGGVEAVKKELEVKMLATQKT